jgi:hypothetical protein
MNVMTRHPATVDSHTTSEGEVVELNGVAIPIQKDAEAEESAEAAIEVSGGVEGSEDVEARAEPAAEPTVEAAPEVSEDKSKSKRPRKSTPRKAAGTKSLVVLREGRVQFVDADAVLVIDLDEAASPDADVHDVVDRLRELRDAVECHGKADAVRALTELIQEKALG